MVLSVIEFLQTNSTTMQVIHHHKFCELFLDLFFFLTKKCAPRRHALGSSSCTHLKVFS